MSLLLSLGSPAGAQGQVAKKGSPDVPGGFLDSLIEQARAEHKIGAAAVVVVRDGTVLHQQGFGVERAGPNVPINPETSVFLAASIGKLFVATAAAQLVERKQLDLNAPVSRFIESARFDADDSGGVTVEQLLTHTSGIAEAPVRLRGLCHRPRSTARDRLARVPVLPCHVYPWILPVGATVLLGASVLTLAMVAFTAAAWVAHDGSLTRRVILAFASALSLGALPILAYWNLLGYRY
ncbi:MAG: beta-lactamase family protein [Vicinamibacteria bacterium]|nr:beta-lactamase family protein [Vicinamibacteria bacterium]